ncbi:GNAT family N-acetyltransferase [Rhodobacteraceae bacterium RKSG542]|uniref:GNAT family N-acetyltransferase n=1 Tax=Pseudovibrio flavus TaxID=2529854 RepID=UPI0012BC1CAD|nr:GNAT family N-acetyltransferase [Pseudovibrio flavus]MTI19070.1 GNAT family N-acetyltransferase [Pseudovibrio flavus]
MQTYSIRKATSADAVQLTEVIKKAYARYLQMIPDLPDVSAGIAQDIETQQVLVACEGARVIGGIIFGIYEGEGHIANLAVDPVASGKGVGRALMESAAAELQAKAINRCNLATHVSMPDTAAFYKRLGWHEVGREGNRVFFSKEL